MQRRLTLGHPLTTVNRATGRHTFDSQSDTGRTNLTNFIHRKLKQQEEAGQTNLREIDTCTGTSLRKTQDIVIAWPQNLVASNPVSTKDNVGVVVDEDDVSEATSQGLENAHRALGTET